LCVALGFIWIASILGAESRAEEDMVESQSHEVRSSSSSKRFIGSATAVEPEWERAPARALDPGDDARIAAAYRMKQDLKRAHGIEPEPPKKSRGMRR
jgi:hypothetical protein